MKVLFATTNPAKAYYDKTGIITIGMDNNI